MLKQFVRSAALSVMLFSSFSAVANSNSSDEARASLQARLATMQSLQADFAQTVTDQQGELMQQLHGRFALARPNLLYWQTDAPDETVMIADGSALWYYNPFVEQVSVYDQTDSMAQSPLLLLVDAESPAWADYQVSYENNSYALQPLPNSDARQSLQLVFGDADSSQLQRIILDDGQGQLSTIELEAVQLNGTIADDLFRFKLPAGVELDDQRGG
ncbi:MAG: Outer-membrane lipoprotein carrier protein [Pseudidiomarina mangrovi]|nr:MAG: Outer-membrane lipoprotein carrier protein [Pseudidiomarina mangrovi]